MLNYGYIDYGFYLAADILPNVRFFQKINVDDKRYPEMQEAQDRYINEKKTDFVVLVEKENADMSFLEKNYRLVAVHIQTRQIFTLKYLLYQKKEE